MTLQEISSLGRCLSKLFDSLSGCFASKPGRLLGLLYVQGLLSDEPRKNVEALALRRGLPPRTLQRFLENIKWDERLLVDHCQRVVPAQHADADAIGLIDETGVAKSGTETAGVQRQYNGNRGKVENAVVHVGLAYSTGSFHALLDARVYLPEEWANDLPRRRKAYVPDDVRFQTKPEIAVDLVRRALANGVRVRAWTFDELYGRSGPFLDDLTKQGQAFVGEIPSDFHVWLEKPRIARKRGDSRGGA